MGFFTKVNKVDIVVDYLLPAIQAICWDCNVGVVADYSIDECSIIFRRKNKAIAIHEQNLKELYSLDDCSLLNLIREAIEEFAPFAFRDFTKFVTTA